ncbi:hypothetical protein WJX79_003467 [Trebouxia sp. C0005]
MAVFEAATIIRAAPWFTVSIFVWSVLSGLLGVEQSFLNRAAEISLLVSVLTRSFAYASQHWATAYQAAATTTTSMAPARPA